METTSGRTTRSPPHPCDITPDSQCTADNGFHAVCFSNLLQPQVDAMRWSFTNDYDPVPYVATSEGACDGNEDVRVVDRYEQAGSWGHTECEPDADNGGVDPRMWCRAQLLVYDQAYESDWNTTHRRRFVACHELGHTLGLRHRPASSGCMNNDETSYPTNLPTHERTHLEVAYGPLLAPP